VTQENEPPGISEFARFALAGAAQVARAFTPEVIAAIQRANSQFAAVQQWISAQQPELARMAAQMYESIQRARQWDAAEQELFAILGPRGWLLSPDVPADLMGELLQIHSAKGVRAVDRRLVEVYSPGFCSATLKTTYSRPAFKAWRPTFNKALRAHRDGDFALAIPVWLMALDGIAGQELGTYQVYSKVQSKKGAKNIHTQLAQEQPGYVDRLLEAWFDVLAGLGRQYRPPAPAALNRHAVLHGARPRVGGQRDSIQCILLLHLLHYFLEERDREVKKSA